MTEASNNPTRLAPQALDETCRCGHSRDRSHDAEGECWRGGCRCDTFVAGAAPAANLRDTFARILCGAGRPMSDEDWEYAKQTGWLGQGEQHSLVEYLVDAVEEASMTPVRLWIESDPHGEQMVWSGDFNRPMAEIRLNSVSRVVADHLRATLREVS